MVMHLSEDSIVVAIYGPSCVGKSSLANEFGKRCATQVRHYGDMVRARAAELGGAPQSLPLNIHRVIDTDTGELAENAS